MKSNYIHAATGQDYHSVVIKCSCGCSFLEIWVDGYADSIEAGITYYGPQHKAKYPDFYFLCDDDFELFCDAIFAFSKDPAPMSTPVTLGTTVNLKNGKTKFNGCIEVNTDEYGLGFMDIIRRPEAGSRKYWWDITLRDREYKEVGEALQELFKKYKELKEVYNK